MAYRYHNEKLRKSMEQYIEEFKDTCAGRNLSIGSLTRDKFGNYSDEELMRFLDELVTADIKDSDMVYIDEEKLAKESDYLKSLLYVVIRTNQAKLGKIVKSRHYRTVEPQPVHDDSFAGIISQLRSYAVEVAFGGTLPRVSLISPSTEAAAETVYRMLTGEEMSFPSPYIIKKDEEKKREATEAVAAGTEVKAVESDQLSEDDENDVMQYDEDDGLFSYDPTEGMTAEEKDEYFTGQLYESYRAQERDEYYGTDELCGDERSRKDYEDDEQAMEEYFKKVSAMQIRSLDDPDDLEKYDKEARRLKIFFMEKEAYINVYRHLSEITASIYESEGKEKIIEYIDKIENRMNAWLRVNDRTVYSDDETFESVFEILYTAIDEVKKSQRKMP